MAFNFPFGMPSPALWAGNPTPTNEMEKTMQQAAISPTPYLTGMAPAYYSMPTWQLPTYQPGADGNQTLGQFGANLNKIAPQSQTAEQMTKEGLKAMNALPASLRLDASNPLLSGNGPQQAMDYYMQTQARPAEAALQSDLYSSGRADSTFGGAELGYLKAGNLLQGWRAGMDQFNNQFNQMLGARQSFFGNEGGLASSANQLNVQRGIALANNASGLLQSQNNNQNEFNLKAYDLMLKAQQQREGAQMGQLSRMDQNQHWDQSQTQQQIMGAKQGSSAFGGAKLSRY